MNYISKTLIASSIFMSLGFSTSAFADECVLPNSPLIPDGNVASKDELIAAKDSYEAFQSKIINYRECLTAQEAKIPTESDSAEEQKKAILALDDASIDSLKKVAEEFNLAVRAFKDR